MTDKKDISVHDLVAHMRGMEDRIMERIEEVDTHLHQVEVRLKSEIKGIDDLDERVQALEEEHLPDRMAVVERSVGVTG